MSGINQTYCSWAKSSWSHTCLQKVPKGPSSSMGQVTVWKNWCLPETCHDFGRKAAKTLTAGHMEALEGSKGRQETAHFLTLMQVASFWHFNKVSFLTPCNFLMSQLSYSFALFFSQHCISNTCFATSIFILYQTKYVQFYVFIVICFQYHFLKTIKIFFSHKLNIFIKLLKSTMFLG